LEYIIIDGGSTDNSVEIIKKYEPYLAYWVSEPDKGQAHALNKGFRKATGQLIGWQNSDDYYHSQAFINAVQVWLLFKESDIIYGTTKNIDVKGKFISDYPVSQFNLENMIPYLNMTNQSMFIQNKAFKEGHFIDEALRHAMDLEFFLRLAINGYKFHYVPEIIGYYRGHINSKSFRQEDVCAEECLKIYKWVYLNVKLPRKIREKALSCIRGLCLNNFSQLRLHLFRKAILELISIAGIRSINFDMGFKYFLSFIGVDKICKLKSMKNIYFNKSN
jgi:glycosyltransferase involved in cell wall biosynthesis